MRTWQPPFGIKPAASVTNVYLSQKVSSCYPAPNICSCVDMRAFHWRVIENLNLRVAPDPRSANALSQWGPDDFIPEGMTFYGDSLPRCVSGPTGYIWCDMTYGHNGTATRGWVAGYYLWSLEQNTVRRRW